MSPCRSRMAVRSASWFRGGRGSPRPNGSSASTFWIVPSPGSGTATTTSSGERTGHRNVRSAEMAVKSVISAPRQGAVIEPGSVVIAGYAWSGPWRRRTGRGQRRRRCFVAAGRPGARRASLLGPLPLPMDGNSWPAPAHGSGNRRTAVAAAGGRGLERQGIRAERNSLRRGNRRRGILFQTRQETDREGP